MDRLWHRDVGDRFEVLCLSLLEELNYAAERRVPTEHGPIVDLLAYREGGPAYIVEVKIFASSRPTLARLRDAAVQLRAYLRTSDILNCRALLIVGANVDSDHRGWLEAEFGIEVWDQKKLLSDAKSPLLRRKFEQLFGELEERRESSADWSDEGAVEGGEQEEDRPRVLRGKDLCNELRQLKAGKKTAKAYEQLLQQILDYLFGEYLLDPKPWTRLEDGLSILDLTYRVKPKHPFWDTLTRDFRARVIVFEFKNYTSSIRPTQIYSTERYVHVGALRPICFVVSRMKPHKHALSAAAGAMRESGKLLILLSDDDICRMLDLRDAQLRIAATSDQYFDNGPTVVLEERIYEVLSTLPR